jgi:hypothetical protein
MLPVGITKFRRIREEGFLYADKTAYIHEMLYRYTFCCLSRPSRFGKSMLIDTEY